MNKRKSVAVQLINFISVLLIVGLTILFICSYIAMGKLAETEISKLTRTVTTFYTDLFVYGMQSTDVKETFDTQEIIDCGSYVCEWFNVDYAYVYEPDFENNTIKYVAVSKDAYIQNDEVDKNHYQGKVVEHKFTQREKDIWDHKDIFAYLEVDNENGHEFSTIMVIEDGSGHKYFAGVDYSYYKVMDSIMTSFKIIAIITFAVLFGILTLVYFVIKKKINKPATLISDTMQNYIKDGKREAVELPISGQDEFAMISSAFNSMTDDIDKYIDNINSLAEEQSNRNAELNIASKIQFGMLPKEEFNSWYADVNAVMLPAKEVGGDFYLYLPLDNSKMLTAIADVSGKGISAAMLMSITLTLMREYAKMGLSPAEILEKANNTIANNNSANFFVTAFVGIYDAKKCEYTYANAGHNVPFLINEKFTCLDGNLGTVLGLFEDEEYEETTVKVSDDDRIYLYTDGVTESINEDKDFYGVEQLISVLKQDGNCIENIKNSIFEFRGEAEQFDDITMMEIKFRSDIDLSLDYNKKELKKIKDIILDTPLERNDQLNLYLSIEELFVNICSYAFDGEAPEGEKIDFNLSVNKDVTVTLKDGGQEFNPLEDIADIEDYDIDTMIGGLGRFLAINGVDDSSYERVDNKNVLTIIKHIPEEK